VDSGIVPVDHPSRRIYAIANLQLAAVEHFAHRLRVSGLLATEQKTWI